MPPTSQTPHALTVRVRDANGAAIPNCLVWLNTWKAANWGEPAININPNPRMTDGDGQVNFYNGPQLSESMMVQASVTGAASGTSEPAGPWDSSSDLTVEVVAVPFV